MNNLKIFRKKLDNSKTINEFRVINTVDGSIICFNDKNNELEYVGNITDELSINYGMTYGLKYKIIKFNPFQYLQHFLQPEVINNDKNGELIEFDDLKEETQKVIKDIKW